MLSSPVFKPSSVLYLFLLFLSLVGISTAKTTTLKELKPVLIKSVVPHHHHPPSPGYNNGQQYQSQGNSQEEERGGGEEQRSSRKIYHIPAPGFHDNNRGGPSQQDSRDPERGQILHRPKSGGRGSGMSSQSNELPNDAPILLNGGKGKKIQYVPTRGFQGPEKPPQVYVISSAGGNNDEDDASNGGVMGSMQTYFKSMTGRIRAAFQGLIGGITD